MKQGQSRFEFQLNKIEALLKQAASEQNPALWLYLHDMRTPTFMLEALCKLYANFHNEKTFSKLKETFKTLEDALGLIDYYAAFSKEFSTNDKIPAPVKAVLADEIKEKTQILNKILKKDNWLDGKRLKKIKEKLKELDWLEEAKETALLKPFYEKQIKKIGEFVGETNCVFDNIEEDVHELRRKMRWLSIYPQAMQGAIKLEQSNPVAPHLVKYLTPDVVNSPFNKFPTSTTQTHFLTLEESRFLALSWMISNLGKLKDKGLRINILKDAIQETELVYDAVALESAYKILGADYPTLAQLLEESSTLAKQYFGENNLANLVV
jgi:hypothetical protein